MAADPVYRALSIHMRRRPGLYKYITACCANNSQMMSLYTYLLALDSRGACNKPDSLPFPSFP